MDRLSKKWPAARGAISSVDQAGRQRDPLTRGRKGAKLFYPVAGAFFKSATLTWEEFLAAVTDPHHLPKYCCHSIWSLYYDKYFSVISQWLLCLISSLSPPRVIHNLLTNK
jgi:hypothetical protein